MFLESRKKIPGPTYDQAIMPREVVGEDSWLVLEKLGLVCRERGGVPLSTQCEDLAHKLLKFLRG